MYLLVGLWGAKTSEFRTCDQIQIAVNEIPSASTNIFQSLILLIGERDILIVFK